MVMADLRGAHSKSQMTNLPSGSLLQSISKLVQHERSHFLCCCARFSVKNSKQKFRCQVGALNFRLVWRPLQMCRFGSCLKNGWCETDTAKTAKKFQNYLWIHGSSPFIHRPLRRKSWWGEAIFVGMCCIKAIDGHHVHVCPCQPWLIKLHHLCMLCLLCMLFM